VAVINPTPSKVRIEGRQRGDLEIVATRWTELRRHHVRVCEICEHRKCVGVARGKAVGWDPPFASEYQIHQELWSLAQLAIRNGRKSPPTI
jgi:hypothetical protein